MIPLRTILRGVLTRFLPALILGTGILYALAFLLDRVSVGWIGLATVYALMTIGYTGALAALRYRLRADADVAGRRSVVAGLLAPAAHVGGLVLLKSSSAPGVIVASAAIGAVLAIGMFFPWLKGAPVAALTDSEALHLLEESGANFADLDRSRAPANAKDRAH